VARDACREGTLTLSPPYPRAATVATQPRTEVIPVATAPAGAVVILEGARAPGVTPLELAVAACGAHRVEIGGEGMTPRVVELAQGEGAAAWRTKLAAVALGSAAPDVAAPAEPEPPAEGRLVIEAPDAYAAEVLDGGGRRLGAAGKPLKLESGRHRLTLAADAVLVRVPLVVDVPAGGTARPPVAWPGLGALTVRSVPSDLALTIRSRAGGPALKGETPLNEQSLGAGPYEVTVTNAAAGRSATRSVTIEAGATVVVRFTKEDWQ
jgi:hypothetical protein